MRQEDYDKLPQDLRDSRFHKSLAELSAAKDSTGNVIRYCLDPESDAGQLKAIDFDAVKGYWRKDCFVFKGKSADALFVNGDDYYLIEFKTGGINVADILRKAYDSVIALVEFGVLDWNQCKKQLSFILVGTEVKERLQHLLCISRSDYMHPSYHGLDTDPRTIEQQIVREFVIHTPSTFKLFVSEQHWSD